MECLLEGLEENDPKPLIEILAEGIHVYKKFSDKVKHNNKCIWNKENVGRQLRRGVESGKVYIEKYGNESFYGKVSSELGRLIEVTNVDTYVNLLVIRARKRGHDILYLIPENKGGYNTGGGYLWHFHKLLHALSELDMLKEL